MKRTGFTLIEMLVVISIISILAGILLPTIHHIRTRVKISTTIKMLQVSRMGLEAYSMEHSGIYPPDTIDSTPLRQDGVPIDNSAQALCYFLESPLMNDDGRMSGTYQTFAPQQKLLKGNGTVITFLHPEAGKTIGLSTDYIIDSFGNPVVYDERKSENDYDGLNRQSFVLISGSYKDAGPGSYDSIDNGNSGMFTIEMKRNLDSLKSDYEDTSPNWIDIQEIVQ